MVTPCATLMGATMLTAAIGKSRLYGGFAVLVHVATAWGGGARHGRDIPPVGCATRRGNRFEARAVSPGRRCGPRECSGGRRRDGGAGRGTAQGFRGAPHPARLFPGRVCGGSVHQA